MAWFFTTTINTISWLFRDFFGTKVPIPHLSVPEKSEEELCYFAGLFRTGGNLGTLHRASALTNRLQESRSKGSDRQIVILTCLVIIDEVKDEHQSFLQRVVWTDRPRSLLLESNVLQRSKACVWRCYEALVRRCFPWLLNHAAANAYNKTDKEMYLLNALHANLPSLIWTFEVEVEQS